MLGSSPSLGCLCSPWQCSPDLAAVDMINLRSAIVVLEINQIG
jgi:hypothetical protein